MENYIVINGRKAELTEEQLKALGLERETSPFSRAEKGNKYYYISWDGVVRTDTETLVSSNNDAFIIANYCTDREMMEQRALHETLNRLLWRYSMEHKGNEIEWTNDVSNYSIFYDYDEERWRVNGSVYYQHLGAPYFATMEIAESAIKEIVNPFMAQHPDFKF